MFSVVIVDDEHLIIESMKRSIDWERHGFQIIGTAMNGMEALELIRRDEPDLVFTDIRMPGLSGLELIKKVYETHPSIRFIIVSGYAEFAYAQIALKQGAFGYCLKPFDEDEIGNILEKAKSYLDKLRDEANNDFLEMLEDPSSNSQEAISAILKNAGLDMETTGIMVIAVIGRGALNFPKGTGFIMSKPGLNKKVYLLNNQSDEEFLLHLENQLSGDINGIGLVCAVKSIEGLKKAISEAMFAAWQFFISNGKGVYISKASDGTELNNCLKNLDKATQQKDTVLMNECFQSMRQLFAKGSLNIKNALKIYNFITTTIFKYSAEEEMPYINDYEQLTKAYKNVDEMLEDLCDLVIKECGIMNDNAFEAVDNKVVRQILDYINSNFNKEITVISLAKMFFISPNYISSIFKKEVGENFKEYLAKIRIKYACDLLVNSEYSIQQIGEKAGYYDYFYFNRIFKRITGYSPSQYRTDKCES